MNIWSCSWRKTEKRRFWPWRLLWHFHFSNGRSSRYIWSLLTLYSSSFCLSWYVWALPPVLKLGDWYCCTGSNDGSDIELRPACFWLFPQLVQQSFLDWWFNWAGKHPGSEVKQIWIQMMLYYSPPSVSTGEWFQDPCGNQDLGLLKSLI